MATKTMGAEFWEFRCVCPGMPTCQALGTLGSSQSGPHYRLNTMAACGACAWVDAWTAFHLSITASVILWLFGGPSHRENRS